MSATSRKPEALQKIMVCALAEKPAAEKAKLKVVVKPKVSEVSIF